jgi:hypothetical protein
MSRAGVGAALLCVWLGAAACGGVDDVDVDCDRPGDACGDDGESDARGDGGVTVVDEKSACAAQSVHAVHGPPKPVDVVFVIDNSSSMNEEIAAVRDNINRNFAAIVQASAVDLHVVMLSRYGTRDTQVCVEPPLAGAPCDAGVWQTNGGAFFHYDQDVDSGNAFCRILEALDQPDADGRAPRGLRDWLRPESQKALVVVTDDSARCTLGSGKDAIEFGGGEPFDEALRFHDALLARAPELFGVPPETRYQFFSIVGAAPSASALAPIFPYEPLRAEACDTAPSPGLSYQALSIVTDALRYPVCEGRTFDAVFRVLAQSVITASQADCVFELPELPAEQEIDLSTVNLEYVPSSGKKRRFAQVGARAACTDDRSFYELDGHLELCPRACTLVQADPKPEVNILYGCQAGPD